MIDSRDTKLADWAPMVLASANTRLRPILESGLLLDAKLARIALSANEPALAQIQLAWWREELRRDRSDPNILPPDPLLASLLSAWTTSKSGLVALVNGWEELVGGPPWEPSVGDALAKGRGALFEGLADQLGYSDYAPAAAMHGAMWARADFACFNSLDPGRPPKLPRLPRELRPLAIIGGLAARAFKRGGQPLFGDRLSPFVALRLGIFGA